VRPKHDTTKQQSNTAANLQDAKNTDKQHSVDKRAARSVRFLLHLRELDAPESAVWKAKMIKYYTHRFNQMCASPPSPEATQWIDNYIAGLCYDVNALTSIS